MEKSGIISFSRKWKQVDIIIRNKPDFPDKPRFSFICGYIFARVFFLDIYNYFVVSDVSNYNYNLG